MDTTYSRHLLTIHRERRQLLRQEVAITLGIVGVSSAVAFVWTTLRRRRRNPRAPPAWESAWSGVLNGVVVATLIVLVWRAFFSPDPPFDPLEGYAEGFRGYLPTASAVEALEAIPAASEAALAAETVEAAVR